MDTSMNANWNSRLLALLLAITTLSASAQLPDESRDVDAEGTLAGPRGPRAVYVDYGLGLILPGGATDTLQNEGWSNNFWYGVQLHRNLNNTFGAGIELAYVRNSYSLAQDTINPLAGNLVNDQQRYIQNGLGLMVYGRVQLANNGNNQGRYLDVGVFSNLWLGERLHTKNEVDPAVTGNGANVAESDLKKLDYTNALTYGGFARVGFGSFYLFGRYRASDLFTANDNVNNGVKLSEFERISVGIGFSVFTQ